jgi:hypothetical protein
LTAVKLTKAQRDMLSHYGANVPTATVVPGPLAVWRSLCDRGLLRPRIRFGSVTTEITEAGRSALQEGSRD